MEKKIPNALAAILLTAAAVAPAQRLSFEHKLYQGAPGEAVHLRLFVSECGDSVAGARFALRVRGADTDKIELGRAAGFAGESFASFRYAENHLSDVDASTGELRGSVHEYRGALFTEDDPPARVLARQRKHLATVVVPLSYEAAGRYVVELTSATDESGAPLSGVFDENGQAMIPPGEEAIFTSVAGILVHDGRSALTTSFLDGGTNGWTFQGAAGAEGSNFAVGLAARERGLTIVAEDHGSFGTWSWDSNRFGPWRRLQPNLLFVSEWDMTANSPVDVAVTSAWEELYQTTVTRLSDSQSLTLLSGSSTPSLEDDLNIGFKLLPGFDVETDRVSTELTEIRERVVPVPASEKKLDYLRVFSRGQNGGWIEAENEEYESYFTFHENDTNGIGVTLDCDEGEFCLGSWTTPAGVSGIIADSRRWYRLEASLVVPEGVEHSPVGRIRIHTRDYRWMTIYSLRPEESQTTVTGWFTPPAQADGEELVISFDVLDTVQDPDEGDSPALFLKQMRVESWLAPGS